MRFLMSVAWRNLWRHRRRSLITATAMAVGVALCMAMIAFTDGTFARFFEVLVEQRLGHVQIHQPDWPDSRSVFDALEDADDLLAEVDATPHVARRTARLYGAALVGSADRAAGGQLVGVQPVQEDAVTTIHEDVVAGAWLDDVPSHQAVIGHRLADELQIGVGDELVVVAQAADGSTGNDLYTVTGIVKTGDVAMDRSGVYLHLADLQELLSLPDRLHEITVLAPSEDEIDDLRDALQASLAGRDVLVRSWDQVSPEAAKMLAMQDVSSFLLMSVVFSVAALGVLNTMLMAVFERTRELGVLRALGLRPGRLVAMVVFEAFFLGSLSCAIGLVLGGLLDAWVVVQGFPLGDEGFSQMGVQFDPIIHGVVRPRGIGMVVVAVLVVCVGAAVYPAWRAARVHPVQAIREDG